MIAIAIGPDSRRETSQRVLQQTAGANVFRVADFQSLDDAMDDIVNLICRMYLTTISRYSLSALNVPVTCVE